MTAMHHTSRNGSFNKYLKAKQEAIAAFPVNRMIRRVSDGTVTIQHYRNLLLTLFHQTQNGPHTFAVAASNCTWRYRAAKEYLLAHALEEANHWQWLLDDLLSVNYDGDSPTDLFPHITCEAYLSFNERVAMRSPLARLAIAAVLEGIGAEHGGHYGRKLLEALKLGPKNASFFLSHAETDKKHSAEIDELLKSCDLTAEEWAWMAHAATTAGILYRAMYDHEGYV